MGPRGPAGPPGKAGSDVSGKGRLHFHIQQQLQDKQGASTLLHARGAPTLWAIATLLHLESVFPAVAVQVV